MFSLLKGISQYMPEYNDIQNYKGYSITISPTGWRGKFPRWVYRKFPFYVNDEIGLRIVSKCVDKNPEAERIVIKVIHPQVLNGIDDIEEWEIGSSGVADKSTHRIGTSGVVKIYPAYWRYHFGTTPPDYKLVLFSADILHRDRWRYDFSMFIYGAIVGAVIGGLIAFILR